MPTEVTMPQLGESVVEGTVGRWLISEGEEIEEYQPLLEVETDKVNAEIPAPASGVLLKILVPQGETVSAGTVLAFIGQPDEVVPAPSPTQDTISPRPEMTSARKLETQVAINNTKPSGANGLKRDKPSGRSVITPAVASIAAEHGIDLGSLDIPGSGRGGRITKKDILAYIERIKRGDPGSGAFFSLAEGGAPATFSGAEDQAEQLVPLTSMRQSIAEHMLRSVRTSPHVTTVMEADMSRVVAYREGHRVELQRRDELKLTFTPFFIQAVVEGLKKVPEANSSFVEKGILLHRQINIGIAVALEAGLIVPVIKDADRLSLNGLQHAIADLANRARAGRLAPDEVQGSTFTLINHGVSGSLFATPIINQPNAGILGVGAIQKRPVVVSVNGVDSIAIKPMCYLSFTFDHRIMDGAMADRFLARVVEVLEKWD